MSDTEIDRDEFHARLLALREELQQIVALGDESAATVELDQTRLGRLSRMDALQAQSMAVEGKRRRVVALAGVAAALARLDAGEFGYCLECGENINLRRLTLNPSVELCIECASAREAGA